MNTKILTGYKFEDDYFEQSFYLFTCQNHIGGLLVLWQVCFER